MQPIRSLLALAVLVLAGTGSAQAQVYRCAGDRLYTDKPCDGARAVDLRANILDAGRRGFPAPAVPQSAIILPDPRRKAPQPGSESAWARRDAREAEYRARTGPFLLP